MRRAIASPSPCAAPVIKATLPASRFIAISPRVVVLPRCLHGLRAASGDLQRRGRQLWRPRILFMKS
jgi:hypothetical protein